jgi:hypothetical protein
LVQLAQAGAELADRFLDAARRAVELAPASGADHDLLAYALRAAGSAGATPGRRTPAAGEHSWYLLRADFRATNRGEIGTKIVVTSDLAELRWACDRWLTQPEEDHLAGASAVVVEVYELGQPQAVVDLRPHVLRVAQAKRGSTGPRWRSRRWRISHFRPRCLACCTACSDCMSNPTARYPTSPSASSTCRPDTASPTTSPGSGNTV